MQLGEMLVSAGAITDEQLKKALEYQRSIGGQLGHILTKLTPVTEDTMMQVLSEQLQIPAAKREEIRVDPKLMELFPRDVLERYLALPLKKELGTIIMGVTDPTDFAALDELRLHAGGAMETHLISPSAARDLMNSYYNVDGTGEEGDGEKNAPRTKAGTVKPKRKKRVLADLVEELERDARSREDEEGGPHGDHSDAKGKHKHGVKKMPRLKQPAGAGTPPLASAAADESRALEETDSRTLLLGLIQALIAKGVLTEAEVTGALSGLLRDKGVVE